MNDEAGTLSRIISYFLNNLIIFNNNNMKDKKGSTIVARNCKSKEYP